MEGRKEGRKEGRMEGREDERVRWRVKGEGNRLKGNQIMSCCFVRFVS